MITVEEAADKLGVSRTTVFKYIADGHLTRLKRAYDRRTYVYAAQVDGMRSGLGVTFTLDRSMPSVEASSAERGFERLLGSALALHRESRGLSVSELATVLGIVPAEVTRAESGDVDLALRILVQWRSVDRAAQAKSLKARH